MKLTYIRWSMTIIETGGLTLVGLEDKADRPIKGFSGGERQRLGIARRQVIEEPRQRRVDGHPEDATRGHGRLPRRAAPACVSVAD